MDIAKFQIERDWVRKQYETHIVRKSTLKLAAFSSFVFIGSILKEIHPFKNSKIYY